jgi:hypothetical protein
MIEPKYDISFIIPVSDVTPHYFQRFLDIKKYCFLNIGDRKIRIKLLIGPDEYFIGTEMCDDWPENVTAELVKTPYGHCAQKISYYHTQLTEEEILSAKWHAKIDDDTANDIQRLMWHLEDEYDYNDKNYLVTELMPELEEVEIDLLHKLGVGRWIPKENIRHEWEGCFVSYPAMMAMKNNKMSQKYLRIRMTHNGGYSDQPVGIALKFAKISAIKATFISQFSELKRFSFFGGDLSHIHFFTGRGDGQKRCYDFFKSVLDTHELKRKIYGRKFICTNGIFNFHSENKFNWMYNYEERSGIWTIYKDNTLAIAFDGDDYNHEFSNIIELYPDAEFKKFECKKAKEYSIEKQIPPMKIL